MANSRADARWLKDGSISTSKIANSAITIDLINNSAITPAKLDSTLNYAVTDLAVAGNETVTGNSGITGNHSVGGTSTITGASVLANSLTQSGGDVSLAGGKLFIDNTTGITTIESLEIVTAVDGKSVDYMAVKDGFIKLNVDGTETSANTLGSGIVVDGADYKIAYDNTTASGFKLGAIGSESEITTLGHTQTLTNKTITLVGSAIAGQTNLEDSLRTLEANVDSSEYRPYVKVSLSSSDTNWDTTGAKHRYQLSELVATGREASVMVIVGMLTMMEGASADFTVDITDDTTHYIEFNEDLVDGENLQVWFNKGN